MFKRNKRTLIIVCSILVILLGFFIYKQHNAYPNISETDSISVTIGDSDDTLEIVNKDDIAKILDYMKGIDYIYMPSLPRGGYDYSIDFYSNKEHTVEYTFAGSSVKIDGTNYKVLNSNSNTLNELFSSLSDSTFK